MAELVVGICECTSLFHEELQGQELQTGDITLVLKEQEIPEKGQQKALSRLRPHFFLDAHSWRNPDGKTEYFTVLCPQNTVHDKRGSYSRGYEYQLMRWHGENPPSSQEIIRLIRDITALRYRRMKPEKWRAWLLQQ